MITPEWLRHMARYNRWQNRNLVAAADGLSDAARQLDRGAFFSSISQTFSHLLWGDTIWIARFDGGDTVSVGIPQSTTLAHDWAAFKLARGAMDQRIIDWCAGAGPGDIEGDLEWFSGAMGQQMSKPRAICLMQLFNHQTHHRGQIHAMLTAAGTRPGDTDIPFMPEED